jgi:transcriptional/translational regulatory protein YebC/TACO1
MTKNEKAILAKGKVSRTFKIANVTVLTLDSDTNNVNSITKEINVTSEQQAMTDIKRHFKELNITVLKIDINSYAERFVAMDAEKFIELAEINEEI